MLNRLKNDFQLSIISLMGLFGVLGITPYAVYRLSEHNWVVGIADCVIVLSTLLAVGHAWRTGDTVKPGLWVSIIFSIAATVITIKLGVNGLFWIYPLILFNFFMVTPGKALLTMAGVLGALVGYASIHPGTVFDSHYQMVSFLVTTGMASILAFIFAYRTRNQRDQLQRLASKDPLTGARNRRAMSEELQMAVAAKQRSNTDFGVLAMDLDHFKQINDRFGHHVGDRVLTEFASLVKSHSRKQDRLYRLGGEEFLLLLPDTDSAGLQAAAEHLLQQVNQGLSSPGGAVTVSIGGANLQHEESWESWLHRADQQLYAAKHGGRNRSCIARPA